VIVAWREPALDQEPGAAVVSLDLPFDLPDELLNRVWVALPPVDFSDQQAQPGGGAADP
jgi:hypothetical protein